MSKGTKKGKRAGRSKGFMGMSKHYLSGRSPANKSIAIDLVRQINRRDEERRKMIERSKPPMFSSFDELRKYYRKAKALV